MIADQSEEVERDSREKEDVETERGAQDSQPTSVRQSVVKIEMPHT